MQIPRPQPLMKYPLSTIASRKIGNRMNFYCDMMKILCVHITGRFTCMIFFRSINDSISPLIKSKHGGTLTKTSRGITVLAEKNTCLSSLERV